MDITDELAELRKQRSIAINDIVAETSIALTGLHCVLWYCVRCGASGVILKSSTFNICPLIEHVNEAHDCRAEPGCRNAHNVHVILNPSRWYEEVTEGSRERELRYFHAD